MPKHPKLHQVLEENMSPVDENRSRKIDQSAKPAGLSSCDSSREVSRHFCVRPRHFVLDWWISINSWHRAQMPCEFCSCDSQDYSTGQRTFAVVHDRPSQNMNLHLSEFTSSWTLLAHLTVGVCCPPCIHSVQKDDLHRSEAAPQQPIFPAWF